jgi:ABC-type phosphate transport system substrate-binding protein
MRTLFTSAAFLAVSAAAGTASAQLQLKGSDTLELVTKDVIAACPGANGNITYIGGGSGTGEAAMTATTPTQHVAPMSRALKTGTSACTTNSRQLVIGLDGIAVVAVNSTGGDPGSCSDDIGGNGSAPLQLTGIPSQFIACSSDTVCATAGNPAVGACNVAGGYCNIGGSIAGCTTDQGCASPGVYTFDNNTPSNAADDWKDVLAQIYGGQNHISGNAQTVTDATEVNADGTAICTGGRACKRNPLRIDCANPVRGVLMSRYGSIIDAPLCTGTGCTKLRHAFRRDDLSGTTDAFQALVGLVAIAPFTTLRSTAAPNNPEIADSAAVASPFCNAGTAALNKGFSDGLDLDPYRRACAAGGAPDRFGLESVCQAFAGPNNSDVTCYVAGGTPAVTSPTNYPQREKSAPQGRGVLAGGAVETFAALQSDYLSTAGKPRCLGVVLPISIPQDLSGATVWATNRYPAGGNCTPGVRAFVNPFPVHQMICPDGALKANSGTCRLPQNTTNGRFDCIVDSTGSPGNTPDPRVYNLMPVDNGGHVTTLLDSYANPNFSNPTPTLRRFARRYFGLHMVRPDNSQKAATATSCQLTDDTSQIGCLVKASPCSIGYAGRESADPAPGPFANVALRIETVQQTQASIEALATGIGTVYPLARKLWFNSVNYTAPTVANMDLVGFAQPNLSDAEVALAGCMGLPNACASNTDCTATGATCDTHTNRCTIASSTTTVDTAILAHNFIRVPDGVQRLIVNPTTLNGCPLP